MLVSITTVLTNSARATVEPPGWEWQFWTECVIWPAMLGAPFKGWRLSCWICDPAHIIESHGLALLSLAAAGSLLAVICDLPRWRRLRALGRA
jgi:hypothetical protein